MHPILTGDQRNEILGIIRRDSSENRSVIRFRIVYLSAERFEDAQIARALRISLHTVKRWKVRFMTFGLDGLVDAARTGAPKRIDDLKIATFIKSYILAAPLDSLYSMKHLSNAAGISPTTARKICKNNGIDLAGENSRRRTASHVCKLETACAIYRSRRLDLVINIERNNIANQHSAICYYVGKNVHSEPSSFDRDVLSNDGKVLTIHVKGRHPLVAEAADLKRFLKNVEDLHAPNARFRMSVDHRSGLLLMLVVQEWLSSRSNWSSLREAATNADIKVETSKAEQNKVVFGHQTDR
ncbi:MAG: helix-turn-helix domain-containing protein [Janthinobacterium lividum]